MSQYVCSRCGEPAGSDCRGGSLDVYLTCKCRDRKVWIDEGSRGGYYLSDAKPIEAEEYYDKHRTY